MNQDQIQSAVRSVLKVIGAILVTHGATAYASILNTEDAAGIIVALIGLYMSHQQHSGPSETEHATTDLHSIIKAFGAGPTPPAALSSQPESHPAISSEPPAGPSPELRTPNSETPHS